MKCVKNKETGIVTRVSDGTAKEMVELGEYTYSKKSAFKRVINSPTAKAIKAAYKKRESMVKKEVAETIKANDKESN